jgi:hypothetical protein
VFLCFFYLFVTACGNINSRFGDINGGSDHGSAKLYCGGYGDVSDCDDGAGIQG